MTATSSSHSIVLAACLSLVLNITASAGVNLKNGNFFITYTDIISPATGPGQVAGSFSIERTYNSHSTGSGDFGFGWGSNFETHLTVDQEGGLTVHENGSGSLSRLSASSEERAREWSSTLIGLDSIELAGPRLSDHSERFQKLQHDYDTRLKSTVSFLRGGRILNRHLPANWTYKSSYTCGNPDCKTDHGYTMERTARGYVRKRPRGGSETFDLNGKLVLLKEPNGYFVRISRDESGRIRSLEDVNGYAVYCHCDAEGRILHLRDTLGRATQYRYDGPDLVWTRDIAGNTYGHKYDAGHNMTQIIYDDDTTLDMKYSNEGLITGIVTGDLKVSSYIYGSDPVNPALHYWTETRKEDSDGKLLLNNRYEYWVETKPNGDHYVQRMVSDFKVEERREEALYSPVGLMSKDVNGQVTRYEYHPVHAAVSAIIEPERETRWEFHSQRKLAVRKSIKRLSDNHARVFDLKYSDDLALLGSIHDSDGPPITFDHDNQQKVRMIRREQDRIEVQRDRFGALKSCTLNGGEAWTIRVDSAVQPHGFVIEGEISNEERETIIEWLAMLKEASSSTYCPEILPFN